MEELLSSQIADREPLELAGASGNQLEKVRINDGRLLVRKQVSPEWDWISRATGDDGRALAMWEDGLFERIPAIIDHAVVAVEPAEPGWAVFMHDVSAALVPKNARLDAASVRGLLAAMAELHLEFWGESFPRLCSLEDRYHLLSPRTAEREIERGERNGQLIADCWELFDELAPREIAAAIVSLANDPAILAERLSACEQTLIHGDLRLNNLGFDDDRVVLVDWGERTGSAPAAVELASFLIFDGKRLDLSRDEVLGAFRELYRGRLDPTAIELALIGGMVQLGCHFTLPIALGGGDEARAAAREELAWWSPKVGDALERHSLA